MKSLLISVHARPAAILMQGRGAYGFRYLPAYLKATAQPAVAVTLPKRNRTLRSTSFFPYFFGLLPEGEGARAQCARFNVAEDDYLARLVATSKNGILGDVHATWRHQ
ncbi:MAG: HipA N-terminal domain-containing protein [Kiritimatiellae bacterium]|nr:HipA N-terminal domain-containing protein [Kiritimatiellia bacterium]MBR4946550.1 HipA N-terminal domain-containing protein [Kiritimatiellia bacterium]